MRLFAHSDCGCLFPVPIHLLHRYITGFLSKMQEKELQDYQADTVA